MGLFAPPAIAPADYNIALGPTKGSEKKFKYSLLPAFRLGELQISAQNTSQFLNSVPDGIALAARPSGLVAVLRTNTNNTNPVVVIVNGTDQNDAPLSGQAVFTPPQYSQSQAKFLPEGFGVDVVTTDATRLFKTVTAVSAVCDATARGTKVRIFGMPDQSTFTLVSYRVKLDFDSGTREPSPTRNGNDASASVKPGDHPVKTFSISSKIPSTVDGLRRIDGQRITGIAYTEKEDVLITDNEYFMGLIITVKNTNPEGAGPSDDSMYDGTGIYRDYAGMPAL